MFSRNRAIFEVERNFHANLATFVSFEVAWILKTWNRKDDKYF